MRWNKKKKAPGVEPNVRAARKEPIMEKEKIRLSREILKEICEYDEALDSISTVWELREFFERRTSKGQWLRELMEEAKKIAGIEEPIPMEKKDRIEWIMNNVSFEGIAEWVKVSDKPSAETDSTAAEIPVTPQEPPAAPEISAEPSKCEISLEDVDLFFSNLPPEHVHSVSDKIDVQSVFISEGMPVTYQDEFCVKLRQTDNIYEGLAAIAKNDEQKIIAIGRLHKNDGQYHILMEAEDIRYEQFKNDSWFRLVLFDRPAAYWRNSRSLCRRQ